MSPEEIVEGQFPLTEIETTKRQFLVVVTGEYLITGFFWVFMTLGSLSRGIEESKRPSIFFFSLFVLMFSNGVWEILTGWYADKFKRQYSISAGFGACLAGFCLMGLALYFPGGDDPVFSSKSLVWSAGLSIWSLGPALLSGAQEAWLVDRCNFFSKSPPEEVDDVFKRSAAYGVLAKSIGAGLCFLIFFWRSQVSHSGRADRPAYVISAIVAAVMSGGLLYHSMGLREEYWSHPKYQTNETLFSFLLGGFRDLWKTPFRWFALAYFGVMSLNYILSSTLWPYMYTVVRAGAKPLFGMVGRHGPLFWAGALIAVEVAGSFLSRPFSRAIDFVHQHRLRIPIASIMYLAPIPFLWKFGSASFLGILLVATFLFRVVHAAVFGSLNTIGQLSIENDERRAILVSIASATSAFLISIVFFVFFWMSQSKVIGIDLDIERLWYYVPLPCVLVLAWGGYLAARRQGESD